MDSERGTGDRTPVVEALSRGLTREAHVLTARPDLLWQQPYNRLQRYDETLDGPFSQVIVDGLVRRSAPGAPHWFHNRTRLNESGAFTRTLQGHTEAAHSCSFSADGRTLASASEDGTVRLTVDNNVTAAVVTAAVVTSAGTESKDVSVHNGVRAPMDDCDRALAAFPAE